MNLDETLNRETAHYNFPTLEELYRHKFGKPDNVLTEKTLAEIARYLYKKSDYQMRFSRTELESKGYKLVDVTNPFDENEVLQIGTLEM